MIPDPRDLDVGPWYYGYAWAGVLVAYVIALALGSWFK